MIPDSSDDELEIFSDVEDKIKLNRYNNPNKSYSIDCNLNHIMESCDSSLENMSDRVESKISFGSNSARHSRGRNAILMVNMKKD